MAINKNESAVRRALLVEDDEGVRRSLQLLLHWRGYDVRSYAGAASALTSGDVESADLLIADFNLPDGTGLDVLRSLRNRGWRGRSILITGFHTPAIEADARAQGFDSVLEKPLRQQTLLAAL
ncbi:response regulator [Sphingomonas parapaucimobilis]|jgi:DNA-binding response OmpR family regulator|uniref:Putative response regulator receiver protein n=1 Tax=Sphingomonas parapaucimobilis NBRC 15100 TaxID=1219049 RepID=A0A0A1W893_9SPHN|nr:response regulator [Sphingomonas parapaucimobilis]GAM01382.1 putative response regulator receiver protein [Sphingomonas parapaucimobilis NBRC 15100]